MIPILEVLPVLSVFPYALLYYGVLLTSMGLALLSFRRADPANNPALRGSLLVIFLSQLILLTLSLMIYQGFTQLNQVFPLAFRALTLVCILWFLRALFWQPHKGHAWLIWALTALILTAASVLTLTWLPLADTQNFNGSWQDLVWVGSTLLTIVLAAIVCLLQNRSDRVEGVIILFLAAIGYVLYLALPNGGNLPASVMISQLIYYPLLISLAWQRKQTAAAPIPSDAEENRRELSGEVAARLLDVSLQQTNDQIQRSLTHSLGLFLLADLCGFLIAEPDSENLTLVHTYDLIREDFLSARQLSKKTFPSLTAHFEDRQVLSSNSEAELTSEKAVLMDLIGYNRLGNLLFYPLNAIDAPTLRGLLCMSPYTGRVWNPKDFEQLHVIAPKVNEILDEAADFEQKATTAQRLQLLLNQVQRDHANTVEQFLQSQNLVHQLEEEAHIDSQNHESEVALWLARQEALEDQLEELQATLRQNEATIAQAEALRLEKERLEQSMAQNAAQVAGLREALDQARGMLEQMDSGQLPPDTSKPTASFSDDLTALLDEFKSEFTEKQIRVRAENKLSAEPDLRSKAQLLHLSRSLLRNALSVSKVGSEVLLEALASQEYPGFVELRASDAGPGLKPEEQVGFLASLEAAPESGRQPWGETGALKEAVDLTQRLGGHWWIHSVPDTFTIHRLAIPAFSGAESAGNNLATSLPENC